MNNTQNEENSHASVRDGEIEGDNVEHTFAYENDLKNFLPKNLTVIEHGLTLFEQDGVRGIEFPVDGRYIDILAIDKYNNLAVIELKVSKGYEKVIGQLLRYKNWVGKNIAAPDQKVRGIIIAKSVTDDLILASDGIPDIQLYEYDLAISLRKVH